MTAALATSADAMFCVVLAVPGLCLPPGVSATQYLRLLCAWVGEQGRAV